MPALIVLFNLKSEADQAAYELWAQTTDVPTVKNLNSVNDFKVFRMENILGTATPSPYQYCEIIDLNSLTGLFKEIGSETMQKVAVEFQTFADSPMFIVSEQFA